MHFYLFFPAFAYSAGMILIIDNYDSFVYTLARYVQKLGMECVVVRNDAITVNEVAKMAPSGIILSPGPCAPEQAGICVALIKKLGATIPTLGVCLGHQAIGEAYGAKTVRGDKPVHGKSSMITHDGSILFKGIPKTFEAGRYHSLVIDMNGVDDLDVTARSDDGTIMAIAHKTHPVFGVQFHPESILTPDGMGIMKNFLSYVQGWYAKK